MREYVARSEKRARKATAPSSALAEGDEELLGALKKLRRDIARDEGVAAFMVFPDRTLMDMIDKRPATLDDMSRVHGIGQRKLALYGAISPEAFTVPQYRAVFDAVRAAGGPAVGDWVGAVVSEAGEALAGVISQLAVTPLPTDKADADYARSVLSRMLDLDLTRQIAEIRGGMQRAGEGSDEAQAAFANLIELETRRRALREE